MLKFNVRSQLNRLPQKRAALNGIHDICVDVGDEMVTVARSLVRVRTGFLRDSIRARVTKANNVIIEATAPYAVHQEFGTSKFPAKPFLGPAAELVRPKFVERIRRLMNE